MFRLLCFVIGYFIGCLQTAYFIGKIYHTDLRKEGSGNLGFTNAARVLGVKAGVITITGDILKAIAALALCNVLFPELAPTAGFYACIGVVIGHDFPFYLHFKGGKGIAATIGMMLCFGYLWPWIVVVDVVIGLAGVFLTGFISVGSLLFSLVLPISIAVAGAPVEWVVVVCCMSALAFYQHRANIGRLMQGKENKFTFKKSNS